MATIPWIDEYLDSGMEVGDFVKMMQGQKERKDKRRFDQEQSRLRKMIDNDKIQDSSQLHQTFKDVLLLTKESKNKKEENFFVEGFIKIPFNEVMSEKLPDTLTSPSVSISEKKVSKLAIMK